MTDKAEMKTILVVDDEADICWSLKEFLVNKDKDIRVVTAASGEEALEILAKMPIDLVITDIRMPGMSGLDLLVEIKNLFPYLAVIVMTAFPSSEFAREAVLKGGMYFIEKPFDIKVLRQKVMLALQDAGQFRGMLTGISLGDLIQIKCISGVTAALRVTEGSRQGVIFFHKGEIVHALCGALDGVEAFYEIISFTHGRLDSVNIAELPKRSIFLPCAAMLLEGARRLDEAGVAGFVKPGKVAEKKGVAVTQAASPLKAGQEPGEVNKIKRPLSLAELLVSFRGIEGYRAAAIVRESGELLAQDALDSGSNMPLVGVALQEFFRNAREATAKTGLEACYEAVLWTPSEMLVMGHGGGAGQPESLVMAVFRAGGNQAQGRREMRKVVARLKAVTA